MTLDKEIFYWHLRKTKTSEWLNYSHFQVGTNGKVIGIDHIKELVDDSINNVRKDDPMLLSSGRVQLVGKYQKTLKISSQENFYFHKNPMQVTKYSELIIAASFFF